MPSPLGAYFIVAHLPGGIHKVGYEVPKTQEKKESDPDPTVIQLPE